MLECVAIALYRQEHCSSPPFSLGRMPAGTESHLRTTREWCRRCRGDRIATSDSALFQSICSGGSVNGDACDDGSCGNARSPLSRCQLPSSGHPSSRRVPHAKATTRSCTSRMASSPCASSSKMRLVPADGDVVSIAGAPTAPGVPRRGALAVVRPLSCSWDRQPGSEGSSAAGARERPDRSLGARAWLCAAGAFLF